MFRNKIFRNLATLSVFMVILLILLPVSKVQAQETNAPLSVPTTAPEGCEPGAAGINLGECYVLNSETGTNVAETYSTPAVLVNTVVQALFPISGLIILGIIFYAGFQVISGGSKGLEEARKMLTYAIVGLIIMFTAYWIVQVIQLVTGAPVVL